MDTAVTEAPTRATGLAPVNILLVDDEVRNLEVLEVLLQSPEYHLVRAPTAEQALMLLLKGDFAVIVLDIQMPGMNGLELATLVKQRKRTQHIPIIFLTAYFQDDKDVLEGYGSGGVDYLTKPINPQILKSKIAVFVDLFRKTQAVAATNQALEVEIGQRQEAEEALRLANVELEFRVQERTRELSRANADLLERERALRSSERQLRLVTDHASVYLAQLDGEHRLRFVNRSYAERFGYQPAEIIGRHAREVIGEAAYAAVGPYLDAALEGRRVEFEAEIPDATHTPRWIYAVHEPERSPAGEVVGVVAVIADITARKLAEQEMVLARDRALAASRAKDDFLARLSHELRTPLNPVLLLASDAAANPDLPPDVRADFEMIASNVTLEARLIDDLLDLTRITRGKLSLELRPVDAHAVLRAACSMVQPDAERKRLTLECDLQAEQSTVLGDDVRLKQIFWNVLLNAVKFTPAGGRICVQSTLETKRQAMTITITDTGIGMSEPELQRVFDAFEQGDHAVQGRSHRFGGLGLGLAISRMLVEMHSGIIRATSAGADEGTTFTIELPLHVDPGAAEAAAANGRVAPRACALPLRGARSPTGVLRILLVEDHTPTRLALTHLLLRRRCEIVTAPDAATARASANRGRFDLLISDIGLPDGDGCDLMVEFRAAYGVAGIALTGYGSDEDVQRSEAAGFTTHLTKPISMQALDDALEAALRTAPAQSSGDEAPEG